MLDPWFNFFEAPLLWFLLDLASNPFSIIPIFSFLRWIYVSYLASRYFMSVKNVLNRPQYDRIGTVVFFLFILCLSASSDGLRCPTMCAFFAYEDLLIFFSNTFTYLKSYCAINCSSFVCPNFSGYKVHA